MGHTFLVEKIVMFCLYFVSLLVFIILMGWTLLLDSEEIFCFYIS